MAWKPHTNDEPQVDPFNAPDPIMPGEEPADETTDDRDGSERLARRDVHASRHQPSKSSRAQRDRHVWHRSQEDAPSSANREPIEVQARNEEPTSSHTEKAPTDRSSSKPQRPSHGRSENSPRARRPRRHYVRTVLILIVGLSIFSSFIVPLLVSCGAVVENVTYDILVDDSDSYDTLYSDYDSSLDDQVESDVETLAIDQTQSSLDAAIAGDPHAIELAAAGFSSAFELYSGVAPEEVGIDPSLVATWVLAHSGYEVTEAYAYSYQDGESYQVECDVYFDFTMPDIDDIAFDLRWGAPSDIWRNFDETGGLTEGERVELANALDEVLAENAEEPSSYSNSLTFEGTANSNGSDPVISYTQDQWDQQFGWMVGL